MEQSLGGKKMNLNLSVNELNEANRMILISTIGLLEALENKKLTINDCQNYLFSPYSLNILQEKGIDANIIELVELGCELEDISSLLPKKLQAAISDIKNKALYLLDQVSPSENPYEVKKWLDR